ncbi:hypothetical protein [uncultured Roseobacter sp.]|uniref:hypothetical protein n=1 Tax=uncultured Roseobacter sp. TaxID=114847 RepID=UPI00262A5EC1|nr:hypothetical protein [uncultured Roseobacter sp.]
MTLIVAAFSDNNLVALADMLVSAEEIGDSKKFTFPLSGNFDPVSRYYNASVSQKSFCWNNSLLLFSGRALTAKIICIKISRGKPESFDEVNEIVQANLSSVDSVIHCYNENGLVSLRHWNCKVLDYLSFKIVFAGSGADALLLERAKKPGVHSGPSEVDQPLLGQMYSWMDALIRNEWEDPEHVDMRYGAGYELFELRRTDGFRSIEWRLDSLTVNKPSSPITNVGMIQSVLFLPGEFGVHVMKIVAVDSEEKYKDILYFVPRILDIPEDVTVTWDFESFNPHIIYTTARSSVGATFHAGRRECLSVYFENNNLYIEPTKDGKLFADLIHSTHHEIYRRS